MNVNYLPSPNPNPDYSQLGQRPRRLRVRRYSARFRRIRIVKWMQSEKFAEQERNSKRNRATQGVAEKKL